MNDIYAYFDYQGTLKERVSAPVRANSTQVNSIYAYWDNQSVEPVTYSVTWRLVGSDSSETTSEHYSETLAIPANYLGRRDLVFFKEAKLYNFIRFPVPSAVTAVAGTYVATIRYALSTQATFVLGSLTFEVEGDRGIVLGESLTLDQYNYLLEQYSEVYDRFLPLTGGTLTGDLTIDGHDLTAERVFAKGYWLSSPDQNIIKLDNTVGDLGELQFGIPGGDYSPTFYGSLGVEMWDGRTKEYPTVKFNYYDSDDEYESTTEEQIATQQWSDARYVPTSRTIAGLNLESDITKAALNEAITDKVLGDTENPVQNKAIYKTLEKNFDEIEVTSIIGGRNEATISLSEVNPTGGFFGAATGRGWAKNAFEDIATISFTANKRWIYIVKLQQESYSVVQAGLWVSTSSVGGGRINLTSLGDGWYGGISPQLSISSGVFIVQFNNTTERNAPTTIYAGCVLDATNFLNRGFSTITEIFEFLGASFFEACSSVGENRIFYGLQANKLVYQDGENGEEYKEKVNDILYFDAQEVEMDLSMMQNGFAEDGLLNPDGSVYSYSYAGISDYIAVEPSTEVSMYCERLDNYKNLLVYDKYHNVIASLPSGTHSGGVWTYFSETITLPEDAAYIKYCIRKVGGAQPYSLSYYAAKENIKEVVEKTIPNNQWKGKKWYAFGTSITDTTSISTETGQPTGKYVPYLAALSGMNVVNNGISGGTLGKNGSYGGSGNILSRILATDVSDADLITIEGFVNDFACGVAFGTPESTDDETLYGCLYRAIKYCQENSNAVIVLLTDSTGGPGETSGGQSADYSFNTRWVAQADGHHAYQNEYNDVIRNAAKAMGCICIDAGSKSSINCFHPQFLMDWIHHSYLGGQQYAQVIWDELKNISLLKR